MAITQTYIKSNMEREIEQFRAAGEAHRAKIDKQLEQLQEVLDVVLGNGLNRIRENLTKLNDEQATLIRDVYRKAPRHLPDSVRVIVAQFPGIPY